MTSEITSEPATSWIEGTDLAWLVEHHTAVQGEDTVDEVFEAFAAHGREYVAVLEGQRLLGLCSHGQLGCLLGTRFGHAIYSRRLIRDHTMPRHSAIRNGTPLLAVLQTVLSRTGEEFYDDIALVDPEGNFLGIMSVQALVRLQSLLLSDKARVAEQQQSALEAKNQELFRSLHELRQSQGRYHIVFENSALGVALLNRQGEFETFNQCLRRLLSGDANPAAEIKTSLVEYVSAREQSSLLDLLRQHELENDGLITHSGEFNFELPGRGVRRCRLYTRWIRETGQICACLDDVTEQRELEQRMVRREKTAMLESLVGGIAHELNNKLAPVIGYVELMMMDLRMSADVAKLSSYAVTIRQSAMESARIIRQLLQLSKPMAAELTACDFRTLIADALLLLKFRLREAGIKPAVKVPDAPVMLKADPTLIKQVVVNLVLNAVDALEKTPDKRLQLTLVAAPPSAVFSVRDNGHGISAENLQRIFDPFFTTKGPDRGTGLGLSVCFSILKQHNGEILVESTPGEGALFQATLPLASGVSPVQCGSDPIRLMKVGAAAGLRVLVVDDEEYITCMLQELFRLRLGCAVEWAANGQEAIDRLQHSSFGLVVSDIRMPGMGGVELYEWIRQHQPGLASRFLFLTGDPGSTEVNHWLRSLGVPVLRKPFTSDTLLQQCQDLMRN
jgi:two-component system, cell cycle sensor histidine kinase and response regulator CckA